MFDISSSSVSISSPKSKSSSSSGEGVSVGNGSGTGAGAGAGTGAGAGVGAVAGAVCSFFSPNFKKYFVDSSLSPKRDKFSLKPSILLISFEIRFNLFSAVEYEE